jgi:hypothetical protein
VSVHFGNIGEVSETTQYNEKNKHNNMRQNVCTDVIDNILWICFRGSLLFGFVDHQMKVVAILKNYDR